jgi:phospholipase C
MTPRIEHLIVLMLENRSYDHMLGYADLPGADGLIGKTFANLDREGVPVSTSTGARFSGDFYPDPGHDFSDVNFQQFETYTPANGQRPRMEGFVKAYSRKYPKPPTETSHNIMKSFGPSDLPILTRLAAHYAVCDRWFSSVPGPTLPNRLYAHAGTSFGRLDMSPEYITDPFFTIYELLDSYNVSASIYSDGWTAAATFKGLLRRQDHYFGTIDDFYSDCEKGDLPNYCFVEPRYSSSFEGGTFRAQNDQHPDSDVRAGESLIYRVFQAVSRNQRIWEKAMLVITYDEHGGLFDHVPPGPAIPPGDKPCLDPPFGFDRYGVRVPAVIVSPYIQKGTRSSRIYDHTSLIATARTLFNAGDRSDGKLRARAAHASSFADLATLEIARTDDPELVCHSAPSGRQTARLANDLQLLHLGTATLMNEGLPGSHRVATPDSLRTDHEVHSFATRVFARARAHHSGQP